jgi:hypothetical protein
MNKEEIFAQNKSIKKELLFLISFFIYFATTLDASANIQIDNFTTGTNTRAEGEVICGIKDVVKPGSMIGGLRFSRWLVNPNAGSCSFSNPFGQKASLQVKPTGGLILNSDFRVQHRLDLMYGLDSSGMAPLNLDLTEGGQPNQRIRITFNALDRMENFNIVLLMENGAKRSQCSMNINPSDQQFIVDFPLDKFKAQLGTPNYSDVDMIDFVFQSGSAIGSGDLAVRSIAVTSTNNLTAIVSDCIH